MRVIPVDPGIDLTFNTSERTIGKVHMSDIYNDYYARIDPKRYAGELPIEMREAYMGGGMALESFFEKALKDRLSADRPGELIEPEHGIVFSPDLVIFNSSIRVGEIKLTWMSNKGVPREEGNGFPPRFDKYITQMANYCHCLETPYARLIAFFVNGDWTWPSKKNPNARGFRPEFLAWDIEFTKREIAEEWQRTIRHGKMMGVIE